MALSPFQSHVECRAPDIAWDVDGQRASDDATGPYLMLPGEGFSVGVTLRVQPGCDLASWQWVLQQQLTAAAASDVDTSLAADPSAFEPAAGAPIRWTLSVRASDDMWADSVQESVLVPPWRGEPRCRGAAGLTRWIPEGAYRLQISLRHLFNVPAVGPNQTVALTLHSSDGHLRTFHVPYTLGGTDTAPRVCATHWPPQPMRHASATRPCCGAGASRSCRRAPR